MKKKKMTEARCFGRVFMMTINNKNGKNDRDNNVSLPFTSYSPV